VTGTGRGIQLNRALLYLAGAVGIGMAVWMGSRVPNADWYGTFDAAGRGIFEGRSPYAQPLFVNPPWTVLLLLPFVAFPPVVARGLVLVTSVAALIYVSWRLGAPRAAVIAVLLSPTAIGLLLAASLDAFVVLGVLLPPVWGLLLLLVKPQVGAGVALYYAAQSWRNSKIAGLVRTLAPIVAAYIIGGFLYPEWIERLIHKPENEWNRSLFPYGIPIGLFLLWLGIRRHNVFFALASTPFFAPYLTFYTYLVAQIGLLHGDVDQVVRRDVLHIALCAFLWSIMLVFKL